MEKFPLSSVYVPNDVPLMVTETAGIGSFEVVLRMVPLMVTVCANALNEKNTTNRQAAVKRRLLLI